MKKKRLRYIATRRVGDGDRHLVEVDGVEIEIIAIIGLWGTKSRRAVDVETASYACETVDGFAAWRAEHPDRSVTISRATMRPMDDPDLGEDERLFMMPSGDLGIGEAREINADAARPPVGWWPVPNLTPVPVEFEGWEA